MRNEIEFPSKKDASNLRKTIMEFVAKHPNTFCLSYEWMLGIVQPKTESEYIQNMFRFATSGIVRRCDLYLKKPVTHGGKTFILRLESYGDSKKTRMQAGVNPLAYSFGKIMLDYVYLFLYEKNDSLKSKMRNLIEKQAEKERYYTALQNIDAYLEIFGEDSSVKSLKTSYEKKFEVKKKEVSSMQQSIKNMQLNIVISKSNPSLSNPALAEETKKSAKSKAKVIDDDEEEMVAEDANENEGDFEDDSDAEEGGSENDDDEGEEDDDQDEIDAEEEEKYIEEQLALLKKKRKEEKQKKLQKQQKQQGKQANNNSNNNNNNSNSVPEKKKKINKPNKAGHKHQKKNKHGRK